MADHFYECSGNGSESCWDCGGQGFYCVATDDDPSADDEYTCEICDGSGYVRCPGCTEQEPPEKESTGE